MFIRRLAIKIGLLKIEAYNIAKLTADLKNVR